MSNIDIRIEKCGHTARRKCYEIQENKEYSCPVKVYFTLQRCGHQKTKKCHERVDDKCERLCTLERMKYGHRCNVEVCKGHNKGEEHKKHCILHLCHEHEKYTAKGACSTCGLIEREGIRALRERYGEEVHYQICELSRKIETSNQKPGYRKMDFHKGSSLAVYREIEDQIRNCAHPWSDWFAKVERIEKHTNDELKIQWLKVSKHLHEPQARLTKTTKDKESLLLMCDVFDGRNFLLKDIEKQRPHAGDLKARRFDSIFIHADSYSIIE